MKARRFFKKYGKLLIIGGALLIILTLVLIFWDDLYYIGTQAFSSGGNFKEYVRRQGFFGVLLFGLLNMIQVLITFIPSEPLQIATGMAFGVGWGILICWVGLMSGIMISFFIARTAKKAFRLKSAKKEQEELKLRFYKSKRNHIWIVITMYVIPAITFGMATIIAAVCTKLKWWQYSIIAAIGSAISIFFTVFLGHIVVTANPHFATIAVVVLVALMIIVLLNRKRLIDYIFHEHKTFDEKLNGYQAKKPGKFLYAVGLPVLRKKFITPKNVHVNYLYDARKLKAPFVVLTAHPSRRDYMYYVDALLPHKMNLVLNRWFFHNKTLSWVLPQVGGFPKRLFSNDVNATKNMLKVIKDNGVLAISPEGVNTIYGASNPVIPSTAKMLKHLKVPVVSVSINGAFLTLPKWNYEAENIGKIELTVDLLFTTEQLAEKSEEQLLLEMNQKLAYDDYKWARENNISFNAENRTKGLQNLLVFCPKCKSQFKMQTDDNKIWCSECGNGAFLDNSFQISKLKDTDKLPLDITEWFKLQEHAFMDEVKKPNFEIRERCRVKTFDEKGFKQIIKFEGEVIINKEGVKFIGSEIKTGNATEFFCEAVRLPMVSNTLGEAFEIYKDDEYYEFLLENGIKSVKCSMAINLINRHFIKGEK